MPPSVEMNNPSYAERKTAPSVENVFDICSSLNSASFVCAWPVITAPDLWSTQLLPRSVDLYTALVAVVQNTVLSNK